jgi:hypothetical protein
MIRFTTGDWLWLMVVVLVGAILFVMPSRRGNGRPTAAPRVSEQELETILLRYEAAKGEFEFHSTRTHGTGPGWSAEEVCGAIERFAEASQARDDLEARVKDLASALDFVQHEASASLDKYEHDVDPASEVYRFQYTRADMEARLRRAEQDLAAAQVTR